MIGFARSCLALEVVFDPRSRIGNESGERQEKGRRGVAMRVGSDMICSQSIFTGGQREGLQGQ